MAYEDALQELYQAPLTQFVAERKRLAGDLKASGDASGAKQLLDRKRPTVSAWVVNQLYWHARDAFDEMLASAEQLRKGHLKASGAHRDAIAKLRKRAAALLTDAGHSATEATLRRVTTTLAALAASGGFDPDPPGTLAADRDPPGFDALLGVPVAADEDEEEAKAKPAKTHDGKHDLDKARAAQQKKDDEQAEEQRRAEMAEKKREEDQRKRKAAERHRFEAALRTAKGDLDSAERKVKQLEKQLEHAQKDVDKAQEAIDDIAAKLADLDDT